MEGCKERIVEPVRMLQALPVLFDAKVSLGTSSVTFTPVWWDIVFSFASSCTVFGGSGEELSV